MKINKYLEFIDMTILDCKELINSDFKRFGGGNLFFSYLWEESFKVTFWFRIGSLVLNKYRKCKLWLPVYIIVKLIYKHIQHKTGIQLPLGTKIGEGLRFFHHDCIIIAQMSTIGKNVSIHQGVTIGRSFYGNHAGVPTIGDNVVVFPGAKIIGKVTIGDNAVIGANAVVVNDVPENAVVGGIPAKIISIDSSKCFNKYWGSVFSHSYDEKGIDRRY